MVSAVSDTSVNATDDVTTTAAVSNRKTTASQNRATDPGSWWLGSLAPEVPREVSQITTANTPTNAAASTPKAVVQLSFVVPTITDVQTLNVEADPVVSSSGASLVVTDGTFSAADTVTAVINKVSPSAWAVSLMTEAVTSANDVIASAMDAAAPTTISAFQATDEVAQTKIVPLSTDAIPLALDVIQRLVPPDASSSPDGFNLEVPIAPKPKASGIDPPFEVAAPEAPTLQYPSSPEVAAPEAPAPDPPEVAAPDAPPLILVSKSNSLNTAPFPEALPPDTPSLWAFVPESPLLDTVGSKDKSYFFPDAPLPKTERGKSDTASIDEKEKSTKSRHHGKENTKPGTFTFFAIRLILNK